MPSNRDLVPAPPSAPACRPGPSRRSHLRRATILAVLGLLLVLAAPVARGQGTAPEEEPAPPAPASGREAGSVPAPAPMSVEDSEMRDAAGAAVEDAVRPAASAAAAPARGAEISVVETLVGVEGADAAVIAGLAARDLRVLEDGEERPVVEVAPEGRAWRIVVYLDPALAAPRTPARALRALETLARDLTELGAVEVVVAEGNGARRVLPPTRDPLALVAVLSRTGFSTPGEDRLVELRREALVDVQMAGSPDGDPGDEGDDAAAAGSTAPAPAAPAGEGALAGPGAAPSATAARRAAASRAVEREAELVWSRLDALLAYLSEPPATVPGEEGAEPRDAEGPAALLWITDGFDLDPAVYWSRDPRARAGLEGRVVRGPLPEDEAPAAAEPGIGSGVDSGLATVPALRGDGAAAGLPDQVAELSRAVAGLGWTVVPVALRGDRTEIDFQSDLIPDDLPEPTPRARYEGGEGAAGGGRAGGGVTLGIPRPTARQKALEALAQEAGPPPVPLVPLEPLRVAAEASGGRVVDSVSQLPDLLADLRSRHRVRYTTRRPPDGGGDPLRPLAVEWSDVRTGEGDPPAGSGGAAESEDRGEAAATVAAAEAPLPRLVAPAWVALATPPAVSELRARRLLLGELDPGTVTVRAALGVDGREAAGTGAGASEDPAGAPVTARVEVRLEPLPGEAAPAPGARRLTLAALPASGGAPTLLRRVVEGQVIGAGGGAARDAVDDGGSDTDGDAGSAAPAVAAVLAPTPLERTNLGLGAAERPVALDDTAGGRPTWFYSGDVELPAGTERVAVVVEEPGSGRWGGTVAGLFDTWGSTGGYDVESGLLPGPKAVNLLRPDGDLLTGPQLFETVADREVARVDFFLDGRRAERVERPPFRTALDLGRLPLRRVVEAVAFDAAGEELGRDSLAVNGGGGRLRVRIVEPEGPREVGPVDVTVDLEVPEDGALDRLELYWRDRLVATLFQPPFRHRLVIPAAGFEATDPAPGPAGTASGTAGPPRGAEGFLRAVARLTDGTSAEDVRYLNGPLAAERVDVRLTELYVVVTDRDGRPVRGLDAEDFTVREDGRRQAVETFSDAGDLPITVGLAIDSSASMFVKLKEVQEAAAEFLGRLAPGRDRAFLVDFDQDVRLAAGTTRDLGQVARAGFTLVPDGRTSLWQAVVYSLVQLQGAPGRKALVVYSDGADEDEDFSYRTALAFARKVGVPIYVIVSNDEAVRTGGIPIGFPSLGGRLERLTREVGGRVWLVRRNDDLAGIYRQIQEELSAQYLLGYYPSRDRSGDWRRVEVDVEGRGLEARTLSGYER